MNNHTSFISTVQMKVKKTRRRQGLPRKMKIYKKAHKLKNTTAANRKPAQTARGRRKPRRRRSRAVNRTRAAVQRRANQHAATATPKMQLTGTEVPERNLQERRKRMKMEKAQHTFASNKIRDLQQDGDVLRSLRKLSLPFRW